MKAVIFSFTQKGSRLSMNIAKLLHSAGYELTQYAMPKYCVETEQQPLLPNLQTLTQQAFAAAQLLVYIGAAGIAVRAIAPFVHDKKSDPAVVCIDERGMFTIPLLSGHIGGANRLAKYLADAINSTAVITTATDINQLPAIDEWAALNNLHITDMSMAKQIAALLIDGVPVGIANSYPLAVDFPTGFANRTDLSHGVFVAEQKQGSPYEHTLYLLPRNIHLGIGCRRDTPATAIEQLVMSKLQELGIDIRRVSTVSSIDLKANEVGLLEFIDKYKLKKIFYSAEQLGQALGEFSKSEFVHSITGVDNVCERAATLSSGGKLLSGKHSHQGVTVAVAVTGISI